MAAITFNTAHQAEHVWERLQIAGESLRKMLNAFVSYRMQLAAAAAGQVRPRQVRDTPSPSMTEQ
jgi:hypothetical protein